MRRVAPCLDGRGTASPSDPHGQTSFHTQGDRDAIGGLLRGFNQLQLKLLKHHSHDHQALDSSKLLAKAYAWTQMEHVVFGRRGLLVVDPTRGLELLCICIPE